MPAPRRLPAGSQPGRTTSLPGLPPPPHRPLTDPQIRGDHHGRKGETKAFTWTEHRDLLLAAHRQLPGGAVVLVWDNLNVHLKAELRAFTAAQAWLRGFRLPAYAPDLNPVEGIWPVLKRGVLANLAAASFGHLVQVIRHGLKKTQYQPGLIEGCLAGTGLTLDQIQRSADITNEDLP